MDMGFEYEIEAELSQMLRACGNGEQVANWLRIELVVKHQAPTHVLSLKLRTSEAKIM